LPAGGSAVAKLRRWDSSADSGNGGWATVDKAFTAYDFDGCHIGRTGEDVWCEKIETDNSGPLWVVVDVLSEVQAHVIKFNVNGTVSSTIPVTSVTAGAPYGSSTPSISSVSNPMGYRCGSGGSGMAVYNGSSWIVVELAPPAASIMTATTNDTGSGGAGQIAITSPNVVAPTSGAFEGSTSTVYNWTGVPYDSGQTVLAWRNWDYAYDNNLAWWGIPLIDTTW